MKSIIPLSVIALVTALVGLAFAGCGQNPDASPVVVAMTNLPATNATANMDTNMPASTNMPVSTNLPATTNN